MLVIRTDFSDQSAWEATRTAIDGPEELESEYMYSPEFTDDSAYQELSVEEILARLPEAMQGRFIAVVDQTTLASREKPILLVDLNRRNGNYGRTFRVIPSELPSIEVNLSLANMDFFEFAGSVDPDGVFRGFSR
ncbi:DUF6924 domain-containing protein [Spirillospora sp. NPDC048823]|uniref:DUF6924 domain-containing protein n=1 Tax=unclassified Spirillospora TaxID=2642701 RepID=UPI00371FC65C